MRHNEILKKARHIKYPTGIHKYYHPLISGQLIRKSNLRFTVFKISLFGTWNS